MRRQKRARLQLETAPDLSLEDELRASLHSHGYTIASWRVRYAAKPDTHQYTCELRFAARDDEPRTPAFIQELAARPGVSQITWKA
jgi:hypothetical protein